MPYTKEELENLEFYQEIARRDEIKYQRIIDRKTLEWVESGNISDGILRSSGGNILLFESISQGEGSGNSYSHNYQLPWTRGWFIYDDTEELNKIIDREFTEF